MTGDQVPPTPCLAITITQAAHPCANQSHPLLPLAGGRCSTTSQQTKIEKTKMKLAIANQVMFQPEVHPDLLVEAEKAVEMVPNRTMIRVLFQPYVGNINREMKVERKTIVEMMIVPGRNICRSGAVGQLCNLGLHLNMIGCGEPEDMIIGDLFIETDPKFMLPPRKILAIEARAAREQAEKSQACMAAAYDENQAASVERQAVAHEVESK